MTTIVDILADHDGREGPLLPILHDVQKVFGHVSEDAMREIAGALNLTRAKACKARGVEALVPLAEAQS